MRLTFDLRLVERPDAHGSEERRLSLHEVATLLRPPKPRALARMLWGRRYDAVRVLDDGLPASGVQAGVRGLAALARTRRFELASPAGMRTSGRARFLAAAAARFAYALPRELLSSALLYRRARAAAAATYRLPGAAPNAHSVTYLRTEPTLNWRGAYVGGAAAHTTGVINGFAANGLDVHVFAPERPGGIDGVAFTAVPLRRVYHLAHWLTLADYSRDFVLYAGRRRPDFVYQRYALGSYAGLELARRLGVPLVLEFNGSEIWAERNWGSGRVALAGGLVELEERNIRDASLVVVVSEVLKEQLVEQGIAAERVLVNPNGVDPDRLARFRERSPSEWRSAAGQPEAPTVGFVGTFGMWHGVTLLPELIERVARERPDVRWVLIGHGPLHGDVARGIERRGLADHVLLPGVLEHERALELLAAAEVCVSPHVANPDGSRFFGSPTKLFEYMGLAKPIVASDLEQIGDVIEHERTGILCPPGDVEVAATAVLRLLGDEPLRGRLGAAALAEAEATYSWSAHTRRILDALQGG